MSNEQCDADDKTVYWCLGCDPETICRKKRILRCLDHNRNNADILDAYEVTYTRKGTIILEPRPRITKQMIEDSYEEED